MTWAANKNSLLWLPNARSFFPYLKYSRQLARIWSINRLLCLNLPKPFILRTSQKSPHVFLISKAAPWARLNALKSLISLLDVWSPVRIRPLVLSGRTFKGTRSQVLLLGLKATITVGAVIYFLESCGGELRIICVIIVYIDKIIRSYHPHCPACVVFPTSRYFTTGPPPPRPCITIKYSRMQLKNAASIYISITFIELPKTWLRNSLNSRSNGYDMVSFEDT